MNRMQRDLYDAKVRAFDAIENQASLLGAYAADIAKPERAVFTLTLDTTADPTGLRAAVVGLLAEHAARLRQTLAAV